MVGCALEREDEVMSALPGWSASFAKDGVAKVFVGQDRFDRVPMDNQEEVVKRLAGQAAWVLRHVVWEERIWGDLIDWRALRKCLADIVAAPESVEESVAAEAVKLMEEGVRPVGEGAWQEHVRKARKDVEDVAILCCSRMKEVKRVEVRRQLGAVSQDLASRLDNLFWQIFVAPQAKTDMLVRCLEGEAAWALEHVEGEAEWALEHGAVGDWSELQECYKSIRDQPRSVKLGVAARAVELVEAVKKEVVEAVKKDVVEEAVKKAQKHAQDLVVLCCGRDMDLGKKTDVEEAFRSAFGCRDNATMFCGELRGRVLNAANQLYNRGCRKPLGWWRRATRTTRSGKREVAG